MTIHLNTFVFWGLAFVVFVLVVVAVFAWVAFGSFSASLNRLMGGVLDSASRRTTVPHFHQDDRGFVHKCFHRCTTSIRQPGFWVATVVSTLVGFPFEHYLYDKVWPFVLITRWLGLH